MKIIAIEEHTVSKAIETANSKTISKVFPFYKAFQHPVPSYHIDLPDLFTTTIRLNRSAPGTLRRPGGDNITCSTDILWHYGHFAQGVNLMPDLWLRHQVRHQVNIIHAVQHTFDFGYLVFQGLSSSK